jgi:tetraacyldisaccharide 4'-kinase
MPLKHWLHQHLPKVWQSRNGLARLLTPLSLLFGGLVSARQGLYRSGFFQSVRLPVPVLVVGNVVAGGAGKTLSLIHI